MLVALSDDSKHTEASFPLIQQSLTCLDVEIWQFMPTTTISTELLYGMSQAIALDADLLLLSWSLEAPLFKPLCPSIAPPAQVTRITLKYMYMKQNLLL